MHELEKIVALYLRGAQRIEVPARTLMLAAGQLSKRFKEPYVASWTCVPGFEVARLPNPWDDGDLVRQAESLCWSTMTEILDGICPYLEGGSTTLGRRYWEIMLHPWLVFTISQVLDAWIFVAAVHFYSGKILVHDVKYSTKNNFLSSTLFQSTAYGDSYLKQLMAEQQSVIEVEHIPSSDILDLGQVRHSSRGTRELSISATLLRNPQLVPEVLKAMRSRFHRVPESPDGMVFYGHAGFSREDKGILAKRVSMRFPQISGPLPDFSLDQNLRQKIALASVTSTLARAVVAVLPEMLPRSVLEGIETVKAKSLEEFGEASGMVLNGYGLHEKPNDYLARCVLGGHLVVHAQHGGSYLQMDSNPQDRLEISAGSRFAAWGAVTQDGVIPVATPRLERIRNTHIGGRKILIVEPLTPPIPQLIRFLDEPVGDQVFEMADQMAALVDGIGSLRGQCQIRQFPGSHEITRESTLGELPVANRFLPISWYMQRAMCTVVYFGTPMIEAMVIGGPTIVVLNPNHWRFRADCVDVIGGLVRAKIIHHSPISAAEHIKRQNLSGFAGWWNADTTVAARSAFIQRFARPGDWVEEWASLLSSHDSNLKPQTLRPVAG